jgi:hypothetical protein
LVLVFCLAGGFFCFPAVLAFVRFPSGLLASPLTALQQDFGAQILADTLCTLLSDLDSSHDDACASRPDCVYALGALKPILGAVSCLLRIRRCLGNLSRVLAVIPQTR